MCFIEHFVLTVYCTYLFIYLLTCVQQFQLKAWSLLHKTLHKFLKPCCLCNYAVYRATSSQQALHDTHWPYGRELAVAAIAGVWLRAIESTSILVVCLVVVQYVHWSSRYGAARNVVSLTTNYVTVVKPKQCHISSTLVH